jgi:RimJ/RimL family protein N-acetyltransferase
MLPGDWREDHELRPRVESLAAVVEGQGAKPFVERLRSQWDRGTPVAAPDGRLSFRAVAGRGEPVGLMAEVLDGTLDAHSRRDLLTMTPDQVAGRHHDHEMAGYATPPDRWRVGVLPGGEPVGFVIAARNAHHAIIAYIRVRPAHRGHGYIDALPAEGTRVLAAQSVPRVRATTDVGNTPMAAAFARAGHVTFGQGIHYHWT